MKNRSVAHKGQYYDIRNSEMFKGISIFDQIMNILMRFNINICQYERMNLHSLENVLK